MSSVMAWTRMHNRPTITPRHKFEGHTERVSGVIHLPGGERIITCSWDGSLRVWNLESGKQIGKDWRDGESEVWTIALSPDGKKVVSGSRDGVVKLWDVDTGKAITKWIGHRSIVTSVCWSGDGRRVLSGSHEGTTREWDVESGETILGPFETGHYLDVVVYSPDTTMFATTGIQRFIKIWDAKTRKLVATLTGHTSLVVCLAWTSDGKTLISGSYDCSIRTWNTTTWRQIAILDTHASIFAIAISPNGRILAGAPYDQTVRMWNLDSGQLISSLPLPITSLQLHGVFCVSFSTDGKLLAAGSSDNNTSTWDVSAIFKEAGLDDLLLDPNLHDGDKALLNDDATRRPVQPRQHAHRVPLGFFDGLPDRSPISPRPRSSAGHHRASLSSTPHGSMLLGRFTSLSRRTHSDAHDMPSQSRPLDWARNFLTQRRPSGGEIELCERRSAVVNVPYAQGKRRNASAREKRRPISLKSKNATNGSSRPPQSSVAQESSGAAHLQPSSQPHAAVSTTPAVAATTPMTSPPHVTIRHAGRWTRFWLFFCCTSPEYTEGHH